MINFIYDQSLQGERIALIEEQAVRLRRWLNRVAAGYGFAVGEITYILCSDEKELEVNRQYLSHDFYTDVITFDYTSPGRLNGDVFISWEMVQANAVENNVTAEQELLRILVHGLLHLTGQGDKTPETRAVMTEKENSALALFG